MIIFSQRALISYQIPFKKSSLNIRKKCRKKCLRSQRGKNKENLSQLFYALDAISDPQWFRYKASNIVAELAISTRIVLITKCILLTKNFPKQKFSFEGKKQLIAASSSQIAMKKQSYTSQQVLKISVRNFRLLVHVFFFPPDIRST